MSCFAFHVPPEMLLPCRIPLADTITLMFFNPAITAVLAFLLLGERFGWLTAGGWVLGRVTPFAALQWEPCTSGARACPCMLGCRHSLPPAAAWPAWSASCASLSRPSSCTCLAARRGWSGATAGWWAWCSECCPPCAPQVGAAAVVAGAAAVLVMNVGQGCKLHCMVDARATTAHDSPRWQACLRCRRVHHCACDWQARALAHNRLL